MFRWATWGQDIFLGANAYAPPPHPQAPTWCRNCSPLTVDTVPCFAVHHSVIVIVTESAVGQLLVLKPSKPNRRWAVL